MKSQRCAVGNLDVTLSCSGRSPGSVRCFCRGALAERWGGPGARKGQPRVADLGEPWEGRPESLQP